MTRTSLGLPKRVAWSAALILLLGLLAFKAGKEGLSNFYVQSAHLEIQRWAKPGQAYRAEDWTRVMHYLASSLRYSPGNPWALEESGTLQLRSMSAARDPQLAEAAARSANVDFRMALVQRPTSPFSWASFALTKLYLGEQDDELVKALLRAEELGPWEPGVQQTVVFVGLSVWNRLNQAGQAAVLRAMQRGAQHNAAKIAEIAMTFNRIDLFCAISKMTSQGREVCSRISKSGKNSSKQNKGATP
ncbi:MAG: hypothetical protein AAB150_03635 [Pseudomonadota bacterium]